MEKLVSCKNAIGHTRKLPDGTIDKVKEKLIRHINPVEDLCAEFASKLGFGCIGHYEYIYHDLGKFLAAFQKRLEDMSIHVDHMTAGALFALKELSERGAWLSAILVYNTIACHHGGLMNTFILSDRTNRSLVNDRSDIDLLNDALANGGQDYVNTYCQDAKFTVSDKQLEVWFNNPEQYLHHIARFLHSCLNDADCLLTEKWCSRKTYNLRQKLAKVTIRSLLRKFFKYLKKYAKDDTAMAKWRTEVRQDSMKAALGGKGIYRLIAATGAGKTLAYIGFALIHAYNNGMDRIIFCIPRCCIVEQTANILRDIFGDDVVVEHHSNIDLANETIENKKACENWDAKVIVTTDVQLFESLMSNKNGSIRKLHNIANSVIIIDEIQLLPTNEIKSISESIKVLTTLYRSTVLLGTATMPSYIARSNDSKTTIADFLSDVTIHDAVSKELQEAPMQRVKYFMLKDIEAVDVARRAVKTPGPVLVVRNTNRYASEMYVEVSRLAKNRSVIYLSSRLCGKHRSKVIENIKYRVEHGEDVIVVTTPIIEVGVDLDFNTVYRELSGMDNIQQTGGRCNRNTLHDIGNVYICDIVIANDYVRRARYGDNDIDYRKDAMRTWLGKNHVGNSTEWEVARLSTSPGICFEEYYELYLSVYYKDQRRRGVKDEKYFFNTSMSSKYLYETLNINDVRAKIPFYPACPSNPKVTIGFNFETLSDVYKLIPDDQVQVIIEYDDEAKRLLSIVEQSEKVSVATTRQLQRYVVNLYRKDADTLEKAKVIAPTNIQDTYKLVDPYMYANDIGLQTAINMYCLK